MKKTLFILLVLLGSKWAYADVGEDFDSLGGNKILLEKARALNPDTEITIVQDRLVSRTHRWEIAPEYSGTFGGDTYTKTQSFGLNAQFHISPRWSLGLKYNYNVNKLTREGDAMMDSAYQQYLAQPKNSNAPVPDLDYPLHETFALVNWYPIYGKMNLLDRGVAHFDVYALAGYGQVQLKSGATNSYTGGGGFGIWWSQHFSTRLEMRYQHYTAQYFTGPTDLDLAIGSVQMGWLL